MTKIEIHTICKEYNITDYTINSNMSIDTEDSVALYNSNIKKIPINFNIVEGEFDCGNNGLKTLKNAPKKVNNDFYCDKNNLKSFKNAPQYIEGTFDCSVNNIRTFDYFPDVKGEIDMYNNPVYELWILFHNINHIEHFNELDIIQENGEVVILDRLNYFLEDVGKREISKDYIINYKVK